MDLSFDADAVRTLGRETARLAEMLGVDARAAEASLAEVSASTGQEDLQSAVDQLLQTLRTAQSGVIQGLMSFGAELEMTAGAVEETDQKLAAKVPTD